MKSKKMDIPLLIMMIIFTILGLIMVFSASADTAVLYYHYSSTYFFKKQLTFAILMWFVAFPIIIKIPTNNYRKLYLFYYFGMIFLLILTMFKGVVTNSAKSWLNLGFISIQPSEFFKPALIIFLGCYYDRIIRKKNYSYAALLAPIIISLIPILFIYKQPDLGTCIIVLGILGLITLYLPIKSKTMKVIKFGGVISACLILGILLLFSDKLMTDAQKSRLTFTSPCSRYSEMTGYQVCNGFIAISNGGLFGKGLGNSTQKHLYLPEAYTDFIFPIVVEELGLVGSSIIVLGFIIILFRVLNIAKNAGTVRNSIIAYGTFCYIILHLGINFLGISALIPLTGVPVPFLSYGGSFLINLLFLLFICERISIENKKHKEKEMLRRI